jgi:hypothetical protein
MPRRLVQQGVEQRRLAKAPDAGDPADVVQADDTEDGHGVISASNPASASASGTVSSGARRAASSTDSGSASRTDSPSAKRSAANHARGRGAERPARRRGRPRGPDRVALNVRIRRELDDRLTAAVDQTGQGPQDLVEHALELLLDRLARAQRRGGPDQGQDPQPH